MSTRNVASQPQCANPKGWFLSFDPMTSINNLQRCLGFDAYKLQSLIPKNLKTPVTVVIPSRSIRFEVLVSIWVCWLVTMPLDGSPLPITKASRNIAPKPIFPGKTLEDIGFLGIHGCIDGLGTWKPVDFFQVNCQTNHFKQSFSLWFNFCRSKICFKSDLWRIHKLHKKAPDCPRWQQRSKIWGIQTRQLCRTSEAWLFPTVQRLRQHIIFLKGRGRHTH